MASDRTTQDRVPQGLQTAAAWSWRILVVLGVAVAAGLVVIRLEVLFVALFVALLVTALLAPAERRVRAWGVPRGLSTALVLSVAAVVLGVLVFLVGRAVLGQASEFAAAITEGIATVRVWVDDTFGMSLDDIGTRIREALGSVGGEGGGLTASAFGAASTAVEVLAGVGIMLFALVFFVHDGPRIWGWVVSLFPTGARGHVDTAGRLSWQTLAAYARGTVAIAAIDAVGIGVGVALVGVPLAGPIAVLVFFGAFIPIVGALISGLVAVLIALATQGLTSALLVAAIVIGVQQLEGNVLQPLIQGRMVALHPLAIVLAVAAGSTIAGFIGAVIAVPIMAVVNVIIRYAAQVVRGPTDDEPDVVEPDPADTGPAPVAAES